jgi:hypothetical protein
MEGANSAMEGASKYKDQNLKSSFQLPENVL